LAGIWWGGAMIFTALGALFCWGARALAMDDFYREACLFLVVALICASLGVVLP
jgi:hypothetical protein